MSDGFAHQFVGLAMLVPAFFLILLVGWLLDKIFVEEVDDSHEPKAARAAKRVHKGYRTVATATAAPKLQEGA
jgi:hypothetical protein